MKIKSVSISYNYKTDGTIPRKSLVYCTCIIWSVYAKPSQLYAIMCSAWQIQLFSTQSTRIFCVASTPIEDDTSVILRHKRRYSSSPWRRRCTEQLGSAVTTVSKREKLSWKRHCWRLKRWEREYGGLICLLRPIQNQVQAHDINGPPSSSSHCFVYQYLMC